jgi:hypothetical protein
MAAAEGSRKDAVDQLKDAERAISTTQRDLLQPDDADRQAAGHAQGSRHAGRANSRQQLSAQQAQLGEAAL